MARYAATQHAIEKGLEQTDPKAGIKLIDDWIEQLNGADASTGGPAIVKQLEQLKTELSRETPREKNVLNLCHKLGAATTKAADKAQGTNAEKLKAIGEALTNAGAAHAGEEEEAND